MTESETAERVNAAIAARESYWRAREINHNALVEQLEREIRALRTALAIKSDKE